MIVDLEKLKQQDDTVLAVLDSWPKSMKLRAYQFLYAEGIRINDIEHEILKSFRREEEKQP